MLEIHCQRDPVRNTYDGFLTLSHFEFFTDTTVFPVFNIWCHNVHLRIVFPSLHQASIFDCYIHSHRHTKSKRAVKHKSASFLLSSLLDSIDKNCNKVAISQNVRDITRALKIQEDKSSMSFPAPLNVFILPAICKFPICSVTS